MRWKEVVFAVTIFTFGFTAGASASRLLSFPNRSAEIRIADINDAGSAPEIGDALAPSITFASVPSLAGYKVTRIAALRERPDPNAPVIERLRLPEYDPIEILDATRDFLRVRVPNQESTTGEDTEARDHIGWVTWGEVRPEVTAIVLDAQSGALVARVPLGSEVASVAFSPNGSRAIFYNPSAREAYEARTGDYRLTRILRTNAEADTLAGVFYGGADDSIHAVVTRWLSVSASESHLLDVDETEASRAHSAISPRPVNYIVSRDGSLGFNLSRDETGDHQVRDDRRVKVEVVDLRTMNVRNSFTLHGVGFESHSFVINQDGSELYAELANGPYEVLAVDTRTGAQSRELSMTRNPDANEWSVMTSVAGDSLLISVWTADGEDHATVRRVWLNNDGQVAADRRIAHAIEAGGARYAVNEAGTRLFRLDENNRIRSESSIDRPELRARRMFLDELVIYRLTASPDGRHIIMFVGMDNGC